MTEYMENKTNTEEKRKMLIRQIANMVRLLVIYFGFYFGVLFIANANPKFHAYIQYFGILAYFVAGTVTALCFPRGQVGLKIPKAKFTIPGIMLFSAGTAVLLNVLFSLIPWERFLPESMIYSSEGLFEIPFLVSLLGYGVIGPVAEEICFRGVLFFGLKKWMKPSLAIIISALVFALYHGNPVQGIYAFIMGAIMGYLAYKTDSLLASALFHMTANMIVTTYGQYPPMADFLMTVPGILLALACAIAGFVLLYPVFRKKKAE